MDRVADSERIATVKSSLRLTGEAVLPGHNFNEATRDRRFLSRLAVPLLPSIAADQLQPMRLKNAAISAAAQTPSSTCFCDGFS